MAIKVNLQEEGINFSFYVNEKFKNHKKTVKNILICFKIENL